MSSNDDNTKYCQWCLSEIDIDDDECKFCGYDPNDKKIRWIPLSLIILLIFSVVLILADVFLGYEFHPIYESITLILVLLMSLALIIFVIWVVITSIKMLKG